MTDQAYSLVLLAGLVAGPASAFLVDPGILPLYLLFPAAALFTPARKGTLRLLPLVLAPAAALAWAYISKNPVALERSARWMAALLTGSAMAGALGASRTSRLLFSASKRMDMGGFLESLAMVLSLAGPFSRRIKSAFVESRREGAGLTDSFTRALSSVDELDMRISEELLARNGLSLASALVAWILLLAGTAGVF